MEQPSLEIHAGADRDQAIPALLDQQGGRMYRLGLRLCGKHEEAEDLVQETFLQAWRKWDQFEGRSSVTTWLYTIAARNCQRMHRLRSGQPQHMDSLDELLPFGESRMAHLPVDAADPAELASRDEFREQVEEAIAALPDDFRMPIILKDIIDLSISDIASILDLKPETVKTRIHRARLRIRKALAERLPADDMPPPAYSRQVCLDLLQAKQDALDHGAAFPVGDDVVCERCEALFASMDLGQSICAHLGEGELPGNIRASLLAKLKD